MRAIAWIIVVVISLSIVMKTRAERPVLVELYTSTQNCTTCPQALEAIDRIRANFPERLLHVLLYPVKDSLETESGFLRYKIGYEAPPVPTIFFDGINRITGANHAVEVAYSENIIFQSSQPRSGRIYSWQEQVAGAWITRVTFSLPANIPNEDWALFLAGTKDVSTSQNGFLQSAVQFVRTVPLDSAIVENGWIREQVDSADDKLQFYWLIQKQNRETQTLDEVLLSSRAFSSPLILADHTFDGFIGHEDALIFAALWNRRDHQADLNRDGVVDHLDITVFKESAAMNE